MASPPPGPVIVRHPRERFQAWLMTGPAGHLWSVVADLAVFAAGSLATRARERVGGADQCSASNPRADRGR